MSTQTTATQTDLINEWEAKHAEREAGRRSPTGFFAVTGLYWLSSEPTEVPGIPGLWRAEQNAVTVDLGDHGALEHQGQRLTGLQVFSDIAERGGLLLTVPQGQSPERGVTSAEVAKRGGQFILRPKSATHPFLGEYAGTERFDYSPAWRVTGSFEPFDQPEPVTVGAAVEGLEHVYQAPGRVRFQAAGAEHSLLVFEGFAAGEHLVLFTDETSGYSTYHALRALRISGPEGGGAGEVVLDFNHAANLPCAYTDLATCPLPPAGNRVEAPVTAGEKKPTQRVQAAAEGPGVTWDLIVHT
ncbi:DUF1684 domain-containing protein [Nesterenkonia alkaliphila]|uniref:DUF1684 domain-containing protein n=1 Tax=Nesterenkonia alkaliphila TaxID=1463631 RepID=A0A7K1UL57_9MICC|nr:DUF1684 domain-containing protein [Nesterenkonia alkaliphila]MVT27227.1 DUF1684 domain-containing protein [Nesterenkonia alkaliphila]GFZ78451.1 hypothetical protein GCM10011359_03420 [Nesterenkonia alkaliphila]